MVEVSEAQGRALDLGYKLGQRREEMGISIEDVARAIHLRKSYIRALENGALHELPGDVYARGYLRRYGDFLEMDTPALLAEFERAVQAVPRKFFTLPEIFLHDTHASGLLAAVGVALMLLATGVWNLANPMPLAASVVMPFDAASLMSKHAWPHRCEQAQPAYPPCSWERFDLWYQPMPDNHNPFITDYEPTP